MKKRYEVHAILIGLCAIGIFFGIFFILPDGDDMKANFKRIKVGMTMAEVETVFERPALQKVSLNNELAFVWRNKKHNGSVWVYFDADDKVNKMELWDYNTTGDKLRRLARWPWW